MTMVRFDYMCLQTFIITHMHCFIFIEKYKVIYVVIAWDWLLLVTSLLCCHDNDNVGLHVCAKFHDHTHDQKQAIGININYKFILPQAWTPHWWPRPWVQDIWTVSSLLALQTQSRNRWSAPPSTVPFFPVTTQLYLAVEMLQQSQ